MINSTSLFFLIRICVEKKMFHLVYAGLYNSYCQNGLVSFLILSVLLQILIIFSKLTLPLVVIFPV